MRLSKETRLQAEVPAEEAEVAEAASSPEVAETPASEEEEAVRSANPLTDLVVDSEKERDQRETVGGSLEINR
jgi:hypothetical protein